VVDAAVSDTTGSTRTTDYSHTTAARLAQRLYVPGRPVNHGTAATLVGLLLLFPVTVAALGDDPSGWLMLVLVVGYPVLTYQLWRRGSRYDERRRVYAEARKASRDGYYCGRDDVAFLPGGPAKTPEAYAREFAPRG
jgi:hypothetical protein